MATKILFLGASVQPFLVSGIRALLCFKDVSVLLYCKQQAFETDLPKNAGFQVFYFEHSPEKTCYANIASFQPDIVFCAGWMYPLYLNWCRLLRQSGAATICAMDTQWKASLKQYIHSAMAGFYRQKTFSHAWVPGVRQYEYAKRLGFSPVQILDFLYAPDTELFTQAYQQWLQRKDTVFPKRFLYVGRLEQHKLAPLLKAFQALSEAERGGWQLVVVGNGTMTHDAGLQHPQIVYRPAMHQEQLLPLAAEGGVFCLCSTQEPWGTVVQEFASAGMPLVVSRQCGSSEHFLSGNGVLCDGHEVNSIARALKTIIATPDTVLFEWSARSHQLGVQSNSSLWAAQLMSLSEKDF